MPDMVYAAFSFSALEGMLLPLAGQLRDGRNVSMRSSLMLFLAALGLAMGLAGTPAYAVEEGPSFDCAKARTADEKAICDSAELSALDRLYTKAYQSLKKAGHGREALATARETMRQRGRCGADASCIAEILTQGVEAFIAMGAQVALPSNAEPTGWAENHEPGTILRERCHMGACGFEKVVSVTRKTATATGVIYEMTSLYAQVEVEIGADEEPRYEDVEVPEFSGEPGSIWVHCSISRPAVIAHWGEPWNVAPLDVGNQSNVAGATAVAHAIYWYVCHGENVAADDIYTSEQVLEAARFDYKANWGWADDINMEFQDWPAVLRFLDGSEG